MRGLCLWTAPYKERTNDRKIKTYKPPCIAKRTLMEFLQDRLERKGVRVVREVGSTAQFNNCSCAADSTSSCTKITRVVTGLNKYSSVCSCAVCVECFCCFCFLVLFILDTRMENAEDTSYSF